MPRFESHILLVKLYACNPKEKEILILFGGHVQNFSHACPLIFC